jgi:hypothetical protein
MTQGSEGPGEGASQGMVEVALGFDSMRHLHSELAPMLSNDGLFIHSDDPQPTDTVIRFRITLPEDFVLIEGTGVVIWSREPGDDGGPAGMAVRYASLSREAQETIDAIIDAHLASGGSLFNLDPAGDRQPSIPTDALDHESLPPVHDQEAAREATARQLEQARLTIRDALQEPESSESPEEKPIDSIQNQYLATVEAQVEEAVAGIRESAGLAASEEAAPSFEEPELTVPEQQELDGLAIPDETVEIESPEFEIEVLEPEVVEEEDASSLDKIVAEVSSSEGQPLPDDIPSQFEPEAEPEFEPQPEVAPSPDESIDPKTEDTEVIESVIPVFLERWKQEIGAEEAAQPAPEPPEPAPPVVEEEPDHPVVDVDAPGAPSTAVDEPSVPPVVGAEPVPDTASEFEVSVVEDTAEVDETPVRDPGIDAAEVMLAPAESARPSRLRPLWLLLIVLIPAIGVGGYFGWKWYVGRSAAPTPADTVARLDSDAELTESEESAFQPEGQADAEPPKEAESTVASGEESSSAMTEPSIEAPPPEPTAVPVHEQRGTPASQVEFIEYRAAAGATEIVIRGNGVIDEESVTLFPMRNPDRILVRVRRIYEKYSSYEIPVGSSEVERIRIGHHPEQTPPALYVVLDLADPLVGVSELQVAGDTIQVKVEVQ